MAKDPYNFEFLGLSGEVAERELENALTSWITETLQELGTCLVAGLLERAHEYNPDGSKPLFVERLRIFGRYPRLDVDPLGDVDVELIFGRRITDPKAIHDYTKASGGMFGSYIDQLMWPQKELVQHLRNRSAALNVTLEDVDRFTDESEVVYSWRRSMAGRTPSIPEPASRIFKPASLPPLPAGWPG